MYAVSAKPMYSIKCTNIGKIEEIDEAYDIVTAKNLCAKYRIALGDQRSIWISMKINKQKI